MYSKMIQFLKRKLICFMQRTGSRLVREEDDLADDGEAGKIGI